MEREKELTVFPFLFPYKYVIFATETSNWTFDIYCHIIIN